MRMRRSLGIYNSRNPEMFLSCLRWLASVLLLLRCAVAADWRVPEAQVAEKIAAITGPGVIALNLDNRSSITPSEGEAIRNALVHDLAGHGIRVWDPDQAAATVTITLSDNLQSYVWVAEVHQGTSDPVLIMLSTPRPEPARNTQSSSLMVLGATTLISSASPILDLAVVEGNPRRVLALGATSVSIYDFKDNHWIQTQSLPINHSKPFPRDLRGRLVLRSDHLFDVYLPGVFCRSANSSPSNMNCSESDDPWPLQTQEFGVSAFFSPARNFFTGALAPGIGKQKAAPPFYAVAAVPRDRYTLWIFAGIDGELHLLDGINQQRLPKIRWGSDLAGIHADCRPAWQVIATSTGDEGGDEGDDSLQAFEFPDREPVPVSQKLNLNGAVTALWPAHDGKTAITVYHDAESGNYEAVQLTLACS